jgi:hypothetical protein
MDADQLVDAFVEHVNRNARDLESLEDVSEFLRDGSPDQGVTSWRVKKSDNLTRVRALETRLGRSFPRSFRSFLSRYSFPAFECGPIMFFANTGEPLFWELGTKLFADPHMSPVLLEAGYIQIGNPFFYNYDPICFDPNTSADEYRIVRFDHEAILQSEELRILDEVSASFPDFMTSWIRRPGP